MTPSDPESLPPAPDDGAAPARPDWLVGAEEGVDAELSSKRAETPKPALRLIKPGGEGTVVPGEGAKPPATPRPPASGADEMALDGPGHSAPPGSDSGGSREIELASDPSGGSASAGGSEALRISDLVARRGARSGEKAAPEKKTAWTAAASSVPRLRLVESKPAARPAPAPAPADDEEEGAQAGAFPDDLPAPGAFPVNASPAAAVAARPKSVAPSESWWLIALDRLRYERRLQLLLGVLVVALIVLMVMQSGSGSGGTSISQIHSHPEKYDGRSVTVQGRVGEVFSVGGGYAFYLHQGRDTLVVFTRSRLPESRQKVTVKGSISTGFLDGEPRQSLFEDS